MEPFVLSEILPEFYRKYIRSEKGELFPKAPRPFLTPEELSQSVVGMTVSPTGIADLKSARILADIMNRGERLGIDHKTKLLELARRYTRIPAKIKNRMNDQQLLAEIMEVLTRTKR